MKLIRFLPIVLLLIVGSTFTIAEKNKNAAAKGEVYVTVLPEQAYIWVDGTPMRHRNSMLHLTEGEHAIMAVNYGYTPETTNVTVAKGQYQEVHFKLKPSGGPVSGPWGRIQIEGVKGNSLVFLNGKTPEFFVGHADEFNNNFVNKQQMFVPVGTHQLYIVRPKTDKAIWSGPVEVKANERLILYANRGKEGKIVYKGWGEGAKLKDVKRFEAGTATATVAVAPVTGKFGANTQQVGCNQPVQLNWTSENAGKTTVIANGQTLSDSDAGQLTVQPKATTKYEFRAAGPGGVVTSDTTVQVDPTVQTSLTTSVPEIRYVKVGDKVQEEGTADLVWKATNADAIQIDKIGPVSESGSQTIKAEPTQQTEGPIDETQQYKITATNVCGGTSTSVATLHVTGSIEPEQVAAVEEPPQLPQTASPLPLLALFGFLLVGGGGLLRLMRRVH
jgi:LPXTG-motif cell wall-anchored protein